MSKTNQKEVLFSVYGMEIREDSLYEIQEKIDPSAPDGFQKENTTKILNENVIDSFPVASWDESLKSWDTGLTLDSKLLAKAFPDDIERGRVVKQLTAKVVKPFEDRIGKGGLRPTSDNNEFWDRFSVRVSRFKVFNTAKVEELYQLYSLLVKKTITPKAHERHPEWRNSAYTVVDKEEAVSRAELKSSQKATAYGLYFQLKNSKDLPTILDWVNVKIQKTTPDTTKDAIFDRFVSDEKNGNQNTKDFIEAVEMFNDEKQSEIFGIHARLKEMHRKGEGIVLRKQEIYLDDQYVGNNFKVAAKKILETPELYETFMSLQK